MLSEEGREVTLFKGIDRRFASFLVEEAKRTGSETIHRQSVENLIFYSKIRISGENHLHEMS